MRINFDFGDLEAFLAVKQTGSFQLAAERLNLHQSAITRRIKKLETALDSPLFERTTRAVKPTLAAKRLETRAIAILDSADEVTRALRDESAAYAYQKNTIVTIAILPSVVPSLLVPALHLFRSAGNQARVRVWDRAANEVAEAVAQGDADFGVCSIPMLEPATTFESLFDDEIALVLPARHPLRHLDTLDWSDLSDETLILPMQGTGNRMLIDEALARMQIPVRWTYEVGRSTTALELVVAGAGLALLPRSAISKRLFEHITIRAIGSPGIARPIGLISRIGRTDHPAAQAFKTALRSVPVHI